MLVAASLSTVLSTCFAAIAALGAVGAIWQTRRLHADDREDRAEEREERRTQFDAERTARLREFETEQNARASAWNAELRVRRLDQLERIAELVAVVRQTAKDEANIEGRIGADRSAAPFFWNARKQLELGLSIFAALGGPTLPECRNLATGSAMQFLGQVVGAATSSFDELERTVRVIVEGQDSSGAPMAGADG